MTHRGHARWAGWAVVFGVPVVAAVASAMLAPEPHGHWSEHLSTAVLGAAQAAGVAALVLLLLRRGRIGAGSSAVVAIALAAIALQVVGNLRVASSIWQVPGDPGFGPDGYASGHDLAAQGDLVVLAAGVLFAVAAGARRWVPWPWALVALALAFVPPPFLWPAFGIGVLLARAELHPQPPSLGTHASGRPAGVERVRDRG